MIAQNLFQYRREFSRSVAKVVALLVAVYFGLLFLLAIIIRALMGVFGMSGAKTSIWIWLGVTFVLAVGFVAVHFLIAKRRGPTRLLRRLGVVLPDNNDGYHRRYANIVQELAVAAGIEPPKAWVLPELYRNALSVDGHIVVTEGLVSTLSRDELAAVVAHEFGHVIVGDIHLKTIIAGMISLLGIPESLLVAMEASNLRKEGRIVRIDNLKHTENRHDVQNVAGMGFLALAYLALLLYSAMAKLLIGIVSSVVSRKYEYLADLVAIELTRDPLSLAQALNAVGRDRIVRARGVLDPAISMCYITNPSVSSLDDDESWLGNLFSTHPPVMARIRKLLTFAHAPLSALIRSKPEGSEPKGLYAQKEGMWVGPFSPQELLQKTWIVPTTLIKNSAGTEVAAGALLQILRANVSHSNSGCPRCHVPMIYVEYEQARIRRCPQCSGIMIRSSEFSKVMARRELTFTNEEIELASKLANLVDVKGKKGRLPTAADADPSMMLKCPDCSKQMFREFFNLAYRIPIDRCRTCEQAFLDAGELEALQAAFEGATVIQNLS